MKTLVKPSSEAKGQSRVTPHGLREIAERIAQETQAQRIVLFGSHAYGKASPDSDVDLLVIMESRLTPFERSRLVRAAVRGGDLPPLDIMARTPSEIEARLAMGDPFIQEILAKGQVLYDKRARCHVRSTQSV